MSTPINIPSAHRDAIKTELVNNHDAAPVNRVLADPEVTLEEMQSLTPDEKAKFRAAITAQKSVIGGATHASLEALLSEAEKGPVVPAAVVAPVRPEIVQDGSYRKGPLKQQQDPSNDFEVLTGRETAQKMGEAIKQNITLLHTRVRSHYIRHADDALLGAGVNFRSEYEHYGRILTNGLAQIGTPGFTINADKNTGDNVVNYSNTGASELIDMLVLQYGNGSKELEFQRGFQKRAYETSAQKDADILAKLQEINEGLINEDGALSLVFGLPIALYITAKVTVPVMKWGIGKVPVVGKPAVALTEELYEKLERAAKGVGGSGKGLLQSARDRMSAQKAEGAHEGELTDNQKDMKKAQIEGAKSVVKEFLFEKYGSTYPSYDAFVHDLDSGGMSNSNIRQARQSQNKLNEAIGKHLPIDVAVMDGWELETKLRNIALDLKPFGAWGNIKNSMYRFFFEKGAVSNLVFQNKYARLSERTNSGSFSEKVTNIARGLETQINRVEIELSNGEKVSVLSSDAKLIKEVMQHVDAEVAQEAVRTEIAIKKEIHTLEGEIKQLKADGIPDIEQGVNELESKLSEAKRRYAEFEALQNAAEGARTNRAQADIAVENAKGNVTAAEELKETAKNNLEAYNEYGEVKTKYDVSVTEHQVKTNALKAVRGDLLRHIGDLEGAMTSKSISFSSFIADINDPNFTESAQQHTKNLTKTIANYNQGVPEGKQLPHNTIFSAVDADLSRISRIEGELSTSKTTMEGLKTSLDAKIQVLKDIGLWDAVGNKSNTDSRTLRTELSTAEKNAKIAIDELKKAEAAVTQKTEAVKKVTGKIQSDPLMRSVLNQPTSVDATGKKTHAIKNPAQLDAELAQVETMKQSLTEKAAKAAKLAAAETTRTETVARTGIPEASIAKLKPKPDGTLDAAGNKVLQELIDKAASTQSSFDAWKSRLPAGYTTEIRDGKMAIKDSAGTLKATIDMTDPKEAAKKLQKFRP